MTVTILWLRPADTPPLAIRDLISKQTSAAPTKIYHYPLIGIRPTKLAAAAVPEYHSILFTSARAVKYFTPIASNQATPALCVGSKTSAMASKLGWRNSKQVGQRVADITAKITLQLAPPPLLYVCGMPISCPAEQILVNYRGPFSTLNCYQQIVLLQQRDKIFQLLQQPLDLICPMFSSFAAQSWQQLIINNLPASAAAANILYLCLSQQIASHLTATVTPRIATTTTSQQMLRLLRTSIDDNSWQRYSTRATTDRTC